MSLFDSYEREADHALNEASKKITSLGVASSVARERISREIEDELQRVQNSINKMKQMSQNARPSEGYGARIQQKEAQLARTKTDFDRSLNPAKGREDLFGGQSRPSDWERQDRLMRDGMNGNRSTLETASDNLNEAHRLAEQSNEIGVNTLNDLRRQREQLINAQTGMNDIEEKTTGARRILGAMRRKVIGNKLILGFIIFILLIADFLIVFFRWIYPRIKKNGPSPPPVNPPPPPPVSIPTAPVIATPK